MEFIADNGGDKVATEKKNINIIIIPVHDIYIYFISLQLALAGPKSWEVES